jgi:hypothetical protein
MRTARDIEAYLGNLNRSFDKVEGSQDTFLVRSASKQAILLRVDPPLVLARLSIGQTPGKGTPDESAFFRELLVRNAASLVHTSFGLEGEQVVLSAALELENLDLNELEAVLDEIELVVSRDVPNLFQLAYPASVR